MKIKDLQTGEEHEYGTNPHDSLVVSEDGRTLSYYNLQNGDGSRFGDYRFIVGDEIERYWNIGGFAKPERKGKWLVYEVANTEEEQPIAWECSECGAVVDCKTKFCPECGQEKEV